jgi:hypothetical protein
MSGYRGKVARILAASTANAGAITMAFNNGAGPGVWVAVGVADSGSRWAFESSRPLESLMLLAEDPQLETKRSNEGCPSETEPSD